MEVIREYMRACKLNKDMVTDGKGLSTKIQIKYEYPAEIKKTQQVVSDGNVIKKYFCN